MKAPDLSNPEEIKTIYKDCFQQVLIMVLKNSGSADDADDIFQEAMLVLYKKWRIGSLALTAQVCTFLQSIARNKWLNELRRLGKITDIEYDKALADENNLPDEQEKDARSVLLAQCIGKLGNKCRDIVELFLSDIPGEQIAKQLSYSSYEYYRLAKKRCFDKLKELVKNKNPEVRK